MPSRDVALGLVDDARRKCEEEGCRQTRVIVRTRTWSGGAHGVGTATITDLELSPRPKVDEQDGFRDESSAVAIVGPITPQYSGGGYTLDQLIPSRLGPGVDYYYRLIGPRGTTKYTLGTIIPSRSFRYMLRLSAHNRSDEIADF